jgi:hypothetical protein
MRFGNGSYYSGPVREAVQRLVCTRCNAQPNEFCKAASGNTMPVPHKPRVLAYLAARSKPTTTQEAKGLP